jgi:hypothetical protein
MFKPLAELDRLDSQAERCLRLVGLDFGDEGLRLLTLKEELEGSLALFADDAVEEQWLTTGYLAWSPEWA